MKETRNNGRTGFVVGPAGSQISVVGEDNPALLTVNRERALGHGVSHVIKRRIDTRYNEKKADNQKSEGFKESFHVSG